MTVQKLIKYFEDIPGGPEGGSRILAALPATYSLAAGASATVAMRLDDTNQFAMIDDEKDISNDDYSKTPDMNSVKGNNDDDSPSRSNGHTNNVNKSEKSNGEEKKDHREKSKDNVNSIESLNDKKFKGSSFDIADSSLYVNKYNNKKKNKKKKKKNNQNCAEEAEDDPDAQIVKCLYFTLMCCECTIS